MGVPTERIYVNFDRIGNTANASLFVCLDELVRRDTTNGTPQAHLVAPGGNVLMIAAESTKWLYGAILLKYRPLLLEKAAREQGLGGVAQVAHTRLRRMGVLARLYSFAVLRAGGALLRLRRYFR
jgi:3-Oxoacyl-[acyl-carrier-protein (ACP)] synthase III C terminal